VADARLKAAPHSRAVPNSTIASAAVLSDMRLPIRKPESWQEEAWTFYDTVGELRYAVSYISNALSRVRLIAATPGTPDNPQPQPIGSGVAVDALAQLSGGVVGQAQMMAAFGVLLSVGGVAYLVGEPTDTGETWNVYAPDVLRQQGGGPYQVQVDDARWRELAPDSLVAQIWRPHRRWPWQPDSAVRAAISVLTELDMLNKRIIADTVSRLAGAGILIVPTEAELPRLRPEDPNEDPFTEGLVEAMTVPIANRESAAAVVPLVVRVPAAYAAAFTHLKLATSFDERTIDLRDSAIKRLAVAMDLPAEAVLGVADVNHWSAWQIEESAIKIHADPMAELICEGITVGYLAPALAAAGADPTSAVVWYDDSELWAQPDRSSTAVEWYDRGELSGDAGRRETGYNEQDKPTDDELRRQVVIHTAMTRPDLLSVVEPTLDRLLGPSTPARPATGEGEPTPPDEVGTTPGSGNGTSGPTSPNAPGIGPPATGPGPSPAPVQSGPPGRAASSMLPDAFLEACDGLVVRALERAGTKLRSLAKLPDNDECGPGVSAHTCVDSAIVASADLNVLLAHAWDRLPEICSRHGQEFVAMRRFLDNYTRSLIVSGLPHTFDTLSAGFGYSVR
jgi:hypothetical protein